MQGFGITRVLEGGELLEKAACSVSVIHGVLTPERAQVIRSFATSFCWQHRESLNPRCQCRCLCCDSILRIWLAACSHHARLELAAERRCLLRPNLCCECGRRLRPTISARRNSRSSHAGHQHPPDNPLIVPTRFENAMSPPLYSLGPARSCTRTVRGFTDRTEHVFELIRRATQAMSSRGRSNIDPAGGQAYSAAAMSLVFHTASPFVPTFRADVRYLEVRWVGRVISVAFAGGACFIQTCHSLPPERLIAYRHVVRDLTTTREKTNVAFRRMRFCWRCCCHCHVVRLVVNRHEALCF